MQLGKKNKTDDMFARVRNELGPEAEEAPLVASTPQPEVISKAPVSDQDAVHVVIGEAVTAKFDKEGTMKTLSIKGDLQLRISDPSLTKIGLDLVANPSLNAQFKTHPNVDKPAFTNNKMIQMKDASKGFPTTTPVGVLRWTATCQSADAAPISFTVWVNKGSGSAYTLTVEYELTGGAPLNDVTVTIPYASGEPTISSFDALYEVSGDSLEWTIGNVDETNSSGTFEFEAEADDEAEFFPVNVRFLNTKPMVDVDVSARPPESTVSNE